MRIAVAGALVALGTVSCGNSRPVVILDGSGGDATGGSGGHGGSGGSGGGGSGGNGGSLGHDECHVDGDCPPIQCQVAPCPDLLCALGTDGFHHCTTRSHLQLGTCDGTTAGCCTTDSACTGAPHGICVPGYLDHCGGAAPPPGNICVYDHCQSDADCTASPHGICSASLPRTCIYGPCTTNADCTAHAGGTCAMDVVGTYCPGAAVFCSYPSDPCHSNGDCGTSFTIACLPNSDFQGESCRTVPPPPP